MKTNKYEKAYEKALLFWEDTLPSLEQTEYYVFANARTTKSKLCLGKYYVFANARTPKSKLCLGNNHIRKLRTAGKFTHSHFRVKKLIPCESLRASQCDYSLEICPALLRVARKEISLRLR